MKALDIPLEYNAVDILERNLWARGGKTALYSLERELSFAESAKEVDQIGHTLRGLDVRVGECVGLLAPDCAHWVTTFFAIAKIGGIAVTLNTQVEPEQLDYILRDCRARVLVVHEDSLALLEAVRAEQPYLRHVLVIGTPRREGDLALGEGELEERAPLVAAATHRDDFCSLSYSSGTTGVPKGVFHAHKDYPLIAQLSGVELFGMREQDRTFSTAKLPFVYGLGANLIMPWYVGAGIIVHPGSSRMAPKIFEVIDRFKPTILMSVPTGYATLMALRRFEERYDLSSVRMCISAGEVLPAPVWERWKARTGHEILDTIGCTESLHTFMANRPGEIRPGSSGRPSPGYELKLVDEDGRDTPVGEVGNLMVKGESVALFYLHEFDKSRHTFRGQWLYTGDRYVVDEDGYYWHAGRSDDMFKVGGLWVAPAQVEARLMQHPAVSTCAVVGKPDRVGTIKGAAFVCLVEDREPSDELARELTRFCGQSLPAYKCPQQLEFVAALPRTATGKLQRYRLRAEGSEATRAKPAELAPAATQPATTPPASSRGQARASDAFEDLVLDPRGESLLGLTLAQPDATRLDLSTLAPMHRALLTTDGMVTKFLDAYTNERIEVINLGRHERTLPAEHEWLQAPAGTTVRMRQVILRGKHSAKVYAYAVSSLILERLPEAMRRELDIPGRGLGRIMRELRLETYREIMWVGRDSLDELPDDFRALSAHGFVSRTYRIFTQGAPLMLIHEKFPADAPSALEADR